MVITKIAYDQRSHRIMSRASFELMSNEWRMRPPAQHTRRTQFSTLNLVLRLSNEHVCSHWRKTVHSVDFISFDQKIVPINSDVNERWLSKHENLITSFNQICYYFDQKRIKINSFLFATTSTYNWIRRILKTRKNTKFYLSFVKSYLLKHACICNIHRI